MDMKVGISERPFWRYLVVAVTTAGILLMSLLFWIEIKSQVEQERRRLFEDKIKEAQIAIGRQSETVKDILYGLRGLAVSELLTETNWDDYIKNSGYFERFRGLYEFAYARAEKDGSLPIKFTISNDVKGSQSVGLDFRSDSEISSVVDKIISTHSPQMAKIDNTNKYVVLLPTFGRMNMETTDKSGTANGVVAIFISGDNLVPYYDPSIKFRVFDGQEKVFESVGTSSPEVGKFNQTEDFEILGRKFTISFEATEQFRLSPFEESVPYIVLVFGLLVDLFWLMAIIAMLISKRSAVRLAEVLTKDLRKFKQAVDSVSDHVIITDQDGKILYANKAAEQVTGYSIKEMLGNRPTLWGKQMEKEWYVNFWKMIKIDKKTFVGEITNRRKNGENYEAELKVSPILDAKGRVVFFVGVERDITKQKLVDRMKTEFVSLTSHQMRTPLTAIRWFTEMLLRGDAGPINTEQKKMLKNIDISNVRMIELVSSLLNINRIETGVIKVELVKTNVNKLLKEVISDLPVVIKMKKIKVEVKVPKNFPEVKLDPKLISNVYLNLLSNAVKYSHEGQSVEVKLWIEGNNFISQISDKGIGIPNDEQSRLFEKFFRGSNAAMIDTEGTGLGMYFIKLVVESSGGKIWFESVENKGSTFWFSLPLSGTKNN